LLGALVGVVIIGALVAYAQWATSFRPCAEVIELFGSALVPTPFTAGANVDVVRETVQRLNPMYRSS
jgi:hypothetical protein